MEGVQERGAADMPQRHRAAERLREMHDALPSWTEQELRPRINKAVCTKKRLMLKNAMPGAAVIDSQSVKGGQLPAIGCGCDAGKKIAGL